MLRRKEGGADALFGLLVQCPVWVGPVLAIAAFLVLRHLAPAFFDRGSSDPLANSTAKSFAGLTRLFAP
jgi:hypothetical protein